MNENGAEMRLGNELFTDQEDKRLFAVELPRPPAPSGEESDEGSSGTVAVLDDSDAASDEVGRCKQSGEFLCFQAGNVALLVDAAADPAVIVTLSRAVERLAD